MNKYKILVLDLDGTLTNSKKEISERNKKSIFAAQEKGIKVILASGRPTYGIVPLAEELKLADFGGYILSYNGGTIINWETKEIIHEAKISGDVIPHLYNDATKNDVTILSYLNEDIITENKDDKYVAFEAHLNKMNVKQVESFTKTIAHDTPKCLIVGDENKLKVLEKEMQYKYGHSMSIYRSEPFFLELMPQNIDKAQSLKKLLSHLNMSKEEMIACGDGFNDLSMIEFAGLGVAMQNAQQKVKEVSQYITLSNDEDGVAHVVDKFILNL
ncbi:MAG: Cof-type HAD-IIB family hydrolase [Bacteroidales bacterium]